MARPSRFGFSLLLILILALIAGGRVSNASRIVSIPESIVITQPAGSVLTGEAPDYWTQAWGAPLAMNDPLGIRQIDSPKCLYPNHFIDNLSWCQAGFWCGQVRPDVSNPDLFLLHPGYPDALPTGQTGQIHPINASYYRQLTIRMYIDSVDAGDPGFQVMWTNGSVADIGNPSRWGQTVFYKTYPGWNIYTIDLGAYTNGSFSGFGGTLPWSGNITGLRLDPGFSAMNNKIVQINWVRLTPVQARPLAWTTNQSGSVQISLQSSGGVNDILRQYTLGSSYSVPLDIQASAGSTMLPLSLPAGQWTVQLSVAGQSSNQAGPWDVQALPQARIVKPGYDTGDDYATAVLHRPWDMSGPQSIYSYGNMVAPTFGNNILTSSTIAIPGAQCNTGPWADPHINLLNDNYWSPPITTDPPINTARYHYLTAQVKLDGTPDVSFGWLVRINWSNADSTGGFKNCGTTRALPLHAGWNTIALDLSGAGVMDPADPCSSAWTSQSTRQQLRFDPAEESDATPFYIGTIKLTATDTVTTGLPYTIKMQANLTPGTTLTYYYNTAPYSTSGRKLAAAYVPPPPAGTHFAYLPIAMARYAGAAAADSSLPYAWNTSGVAAGTYYISVDINNGYNTTTIYSDAPVVVTQ